MTQRELLVCARDQMQLWVRILDEAYCNADWGLIESAMHRITDTKETIDEELESEASE